MKEILNHYSSMHFLFQTYNFFTRQICSVEKWLLTAIEIYRRRKIEAIENLQYMIVPSQSYYKLLCRIVYHYIKGKQNFHVLMANTLWSYQLLQKGRRFSAAKLHDIDFNGPLMPLSCIDIQYWVSYNPEICRKSWKMTSRKKIRFLGLAQIVPLFDGLIF